MRTPAPILLLVLVMATLASSDARAGDQLIVAFDEPAVGRIAAIDVEPPFSAVTQGLALGRDARVRAVFGRILHLSRESGVLSLVDPETWSVEQSFDLGAASGVRDVVASDADTLWVSRRDASHLLRIDLVTGRTTEAVDLSPLGVGDGDPAMETLLVHEGRLYVQLPGPIGFPDPSYLAVVDLASEAIVDADPATPGPQAILLQGTSPRFKMQAVPGSGALMLSSTGAFHDFGGLELVDLAGLQSLGVAVREWLDVGCNDIGAFAMLDDERGWLACSTDIVLSSHLHAFTISGGGNTPEADNSLQYFAPHLVHHQATNTIFWPEPAGVQAFDADTGLARAAAVALPGEPTDLALRLAGPAAVPSLPPALLPLAGLALAWTARRSAGRRTRR